MVTIDEIWQKLEEISDPEIPVLSIVDLGIVRVVDVKEGVAHVVITPTYSGCPAMNVIEEEIQSKLTPFIKLDLSTQLSPAWTTDWMSEAGKEKLKAYGIAPPVDGPGGMFSEVKVPCPRCDSSNTKLVSQFGSTACKSFYQCNDCFEPFDHFKCHR
ncbi:MAG: phenylacetate-CoA oxygenase subunit PaaJ [Bacteriovoracaceae bacterium]|nr:phenylacetate-CoA oxygenase subunit PaaJ [Bacteriovoracaceae bacterium]